MKNLYLEENDVLVFDKEIFVDTSYRVGYEIDVAVWTFLKLHLEREATDVQLSVREHIRQRMEDK